MRQIKGPKTAKKSPRWRSGDACVTNPNSRKFRDQAKQNITSYQKESRQKGLTASALAKHDEDLANSDDDDDVDVKDDDYFSERTQSTVTRASNVSSISGLTDCSNMTFQKVQKLWASPADDHKQICAVLAAVTDVIRSKDGTETETEYFATLMVALQAAKDEESQSAITFLLCLVIKKVPLNVLRAKFSEVSKLLFDLLTQHHQSGKTAMLKHLISCLSTLLLNQDPSIWSYSSTMQIFHCMLTFSVHPRPKVRKSAQLAVKSLLKTHLANHETHPAEDAAGKFCFRNLEEQSPESSTLALHTLNLLKMILRYLGQESIRSICESIMKVMRQGNLPTKTNCLQTLHAMFDSHPPETNLPPALNGKIISALYDFQPSINDVHLSPAWLKVMESAHANLSITDSVQCMAVLPKLISSAMAYMLADSKEVARAAAEAIKAVTQECLQPISDDIINGAEDGLLGHFGLIFRSVEQGLKYKHQSAWDLVLQLLALLFQLFGKGCSRMMSKCLVTLCDLHESHKFPYLPELEKAIGSAIGAMGPRIILAAVPLNLIRSDDKCEFSRAWMLPLMKDHIQNTELEFFTTYFLPLAAQLSEKGAACSRNGQALEAKVYSTLQQQIWSLLPSFCKHPTDLKESFKNIARILGKALTEKVELQVFILQALRILISRTDSDEELAEVGKFGKNYLPILFNLYTSKAEEKAPELLSVLETIRAYLTLTDQQLVLVLLGNAQKKLEDADILPEKRLAVMDLIAAMVTHVDETHVDSVYSATLPLILTQDVKVQKKAYRILEEICNGRSDACRHFVLSNLDDLGRNILQSVSSAAPSAKAPRLRCITGILRKLSSEHKEFLKSILPEVILCTKASHVKAKAAAVNLIEEIGNAYIYFESSPKEECVAQYAQLMMAGLAGSPHMISATLTSLTKIVRLYKECLSSALVEMLFASGINLLQSREREVTRSALGFVKALISALERDELHGHIHALIKNLFAGRRGDKNFLRTQTQFVLEKVIRKLGYENVRAAVPENIKKFLINIHKNIEKQRKAKSAGYEARSEKRKKMASSLKSSEDILDDLSSDGEDDGVTGAQETTKSERWILEQSDEVVDLLDSKVAKQITGSKPYSKKKTRELNAGFSLATDGKLIIEDKDAAPPQAAAQKRPLEQTETSLSSLSLKDEQSSMAVFGKRQRGDLEDTGNKYQPGGAGIHRPLAKRSRQLDNDVVKKPFGGDYKAKKAGGDVKLRGKPDPFAYIPLTLQSLNKR